MTDSSDRKAFESGRNVRNQDTVRQVVNDLDDSLRPGRHSKSEKEAYRKGRDTDKSLDED